VDNSNPYVSPQQTDGENSAMKCSAQPRRPLSILILGAALFIMFAAGLVLFLVSIIRDWAAFIEAPAYALLPMVRIALCGLTAIGLFRRWKWSRWALCALLLIVAASPWKHIIQGTGSMVEAEFAAGRNPDDTAAPRIFVALLWAMMWIVVACMVAFRSKVTDYFRCSANGGGRI